MKQKKSPRANLENKRWTFFQIGLVISLSLVLFAFECTRTSYSIKEFDPVSFKSFEDEHMPITRAEKKPEPKPRQVFEIKIEDIVENQIEVNDYLININSESDENMKFEPVIFDDEKPVATYDYYGIKIKPEFPGGMDGFLKDIYSRIKYPDEAIRNNVSGTVFLEFIINEKGKMDSIRVIRSVHPSLDSEALKILEQTSDWQPGIEHGKAVKVRFRIPVKFELR